MVFTFSFCFIGFFCGYAASNILSMLVFVVVYVTPLCGSVWCNSSYSYIFSDIFKNVIGMFF